MSDHDRFRWLQESGTDPEAYVSYEGGDTPGDSLQEIAADQEADEASRTSNVPRNLRMRDEIQVEARVLWPALGFPAVIAPRANGSQDALEGNPTRCITVLVLSNHPNLSKEDAARYLRIVPWAQRNRRFIPSGQAGSFDPQSIQVRNDDGGKRLAWGVKDEHGDAVVFGSSRSLAPGAQLEDSAIAVSLSRHVRQFYKNLPHLHEIRVSEAASAKFADGQYHVFWNNENARGTPDEVSDEMRYLIDNFARPRRQALGKKWSGQLEFFVNEYRHDYGALHPPYQQWDSQKRLTEVLHPVFISRKSAPLRVAHITDTHVAVRHDVYEANLAAGKNLPRYSFNNFNRSFSAIYSDAKKASDILLLTGDLIDYGRGHVGLIENGRFRDSLGDDDAYHKDRNWMLFYYLLASGENYTCPAYTILGNHDWRVTPYPPFAPGTPDPELFFHNEAEFKDRGQLKNLLVTAHGSGWRHGFAYKVGAESAGALLFQHPVAALRGIAGKLDVDGSPLQTVIDSVIWYLLLINPFLDYSVKLPDGQQLLMLDWAENEEVMNSDEPRTFMGFGQRASDSLTPLQKWHVEEFVDLPGNAKIIAMHAPPIGPFPEWSDSDLAKGVKQYGSREDSRARTPDGKIVKLTTHSLFAIQPKNEPNWVTAEYGTFLKERERFIQLVSDPRKGVRLVLSGHNHRNGLFTVSAPAKDRSLRVIHAVKYESVRGIRPPGVAAQGPNTYLGPLYVNTTSGGPRGNLWENGHHTVSPGWALVTLAADGTIGGVSPRQIVPAAPHNELEYDSQEFASGSFYPQPERFHRRRRFQPQLFGQFTR